MTLTKLSSNKIRKHLTAAGWMAGGFLLAVALLVDPWSLHSLDDHLLGRHPAAHQHGEAEDGRLWTCGMHPQVIEPEPGQCPICHMDLTPLAVETGATAEAAGWSCPLHPTISEQEPGECPICGSPLEQAAPAAEGEGEILYYRHPHDPTVTSPAPAKDPMGMDYVPVYAGETDARGSGAAVRIDPTVVQNMNVRTAPVERRDLKHPIRTVGYLDYDQERMVSVTTKYSGWVEKVHVNYVGEPVRAGQPLFEIYSPELVQTQQELLSALDFAYRMRETPPETRRRAEALVESARTRLGYWDISHQQVAELEATRHVFRTLTVAAPAGGLVMKRMPGLEGMAVRPGMEIFHIADLSTLWLTVEIFEDQVAWVREGISAEVELTYFPGETFRGTVLFLEPEFSEKTRTMRVKIAVPNPGGRLRKGMFATVVFDPVAVKQAIVVPSQAVLRTGQRSVVVVALGGGRFAPREVVLGHEAQGLTQVLEGVEEGEELVISSQFLLDSESKLREAIQKMLAERNAADHS